MLRVELRSACGRASSDSQVSRLSTDSAPSEIYELEEGLCGVVRGAFVAHRQSLADAGLRVELEPIHRSGHGDSYRSHIEAVVRYLDDDVHDILYLPVAQNGHVVVLREIAEAWVQDTVAEIIARPSE